MVVAAHRQIHPIGWEHSARRTVKSAWQIGDLSCGAPSDNTYPNVDDFAAPFEGPGERSIRGLVINIHVRRSICIHELKSSAAPLERLGARPPLGARAAAHMPMKCLRRTIWSGLPGEMRRSAGGHLGCLIRHVFKHLNGLKTLNGLVSECTFCGPSFSVSVWGDDDPDF